MLERLGIVIYRLGCVIAGLCVALVMLLLISGVFFNGKWPDILLGIVILPIVALIIWLVGFSIRYILAGERPQG